MKGLSASKYILQDDPDTEPVSLKKNDKDIKNKTNDQIVIPPLNHCVSRAPRYKNIIYYQKSSHACKQPESDGYKMAAVSFCGKQSYFWFEAFFVISSTL